MSCRVVVGTLSSVASPARKLPKATQVEALGVRLGRSASLLVTTGGAAVSTGTQQRWLAQPRQPVSKPSAHKTDRRQSIVHPSTDSCLANGTPSAGVRLKTRR